MAPPFDPRISPRSTTYRRSDANCSCQSTQGGNEGYIIPLKIFRFGIRHFCQLSWGIHGFVQSLGFGMKSRPCSWGTQDQRYLWLTWAEKHNFKPSNSHTFTWVCLKRTRPKTPCLNICHITNIIFWYFMGIHMFQHTHSLPFQNLDPTHATPHETASWCCSRQNCQANKRIKTTASCAPQIQRSMLLFDRFVG